MVLGFCNICIRFEPCEITVSTVHKLLPVSNFTRFKLTERLFYFETTKKFSCSSHGLMISFFKYKYLIHLVGLQLKFFPDGHPFVWHQVLNNYLFLTDLKYHLYHVLSCYMCLKVCLDFLVCFIALTIFRCWYYVLNLIMKKFKHTEM